MIKTKIHFDVTPFYRAYNRAPRGRGGWAFCLAGDGEKNNYLDLVFWANGTYAEAKKAACMHYAEKYAGQTDVHVEVLS